MFQLCKQSKQAKAHHVSNNRNTRALFPPPTRQDLTQGQWPEGRLKVGIRGGERTSSSQGSKPAGLSWSLAHLVLYEPDEPSWTWTQTWVQAQMPDYSLNWTTRSSAILAGQCPLRAHQAKRSRKRQRIRQPCEYIYHGPQQIREVLQTSIFNLESLVLIRSVKEIGRQAFSRTTAHSDPWPGNKRGKDVRPWR